MLVDPHVALIRASLTVVDWSNIMALQQYDHDD